MRLHAVLCAVVCAVVCATAILTASAAAQSPASPHDSRTRIPAVPANATAEPAARPSVVTLKPLGAPNVARNQVCYAIRAYNFAAEPTADVTKPTGVTTCEAAKENGFHAASATLVR